MDRDRDRGRDRDRRDDRYVNSYRPRSPGSRADSYRNTRSPPRPRGMLAADTYTPGGRTSRPRSRSPPYRRRSRSPRRDDRDMWRGRPRSPPRRAFSPRRDDFRDRPRSPRRDGYDSYPRSPRPRERSPLPRARERDVSPPSARSPPPRLRRDSPPPRASRYEEPRSRAHSPYRRAYSPPRDYRRGRSPSPRRERVDPYAQDNWRRGPSHSPARQPYGSNEASGRQSAASSRRSSPPVHASRTSLVPDTGPLREGMSAPRSPYRERDERDYAREREVPLRPRETPPTGPRSEREYAIGGAPPTGPSSYRNDQNFSRAPPTGPSSRNYPSPAISPPVGPGSHQPPAYPRSSNPVLAAPTRPRGGGRGGYGGESYRDFSGGPPSRRGSWGGARGGFHGGGPPAGGRGGGYAPPFRGSSNSTSTTYPRTIRFNHLADLPREIPGGQRAPELFDKSKISKLEEEARRLRELIDAKETGKRQKLKEWEQLEHDANNAGLRSDLAEAQLRSLNGDGDAEGAAF